MQECRVCAAHSVVHAAADSVIAEAEGESDVVADLGAAVRVTSAEANFLRN